MATDGIEAACLDSEWPHAQPLADGSPSTVFVMDSDEAARSAVETERVFRRWGKHKFPFFGFR
jgi:hypothetical protein